MTPLTIRASASTTSAQATSKGSTAAGSGVMGIMRAAATTATTAELVPVADSRSARHRQLDGIDLGPLLPEVRDFLRHARAIKELRFRFEVGFRHPLPLDGCPKLLALAAPIPPAP